MTKIHEMSNDRLTRPFSCPYIGMCSIEPVDLDGDGLLDLTVSVSSAALSQVSMN